MKILNILIIALFLCSSMYAKSHASHGESKKDLEKKLKDLSKEMQTKYKKDPGYKKADRKLIL